MLGAFGPSCMMAPLRGLETCTSACLGLSAHALRWHRYAVGKLALQHAWGFRPTLYDGTATRFRNLHFSMLGAFGPRSTMAPLRGWETCTSACLGLSAHAV